MGQLLCVQTRFFSDRTHKSTAQRTVKLFARCCFYAILNYSYSSQLKNRFDLDGQLAVCLQNFCIFRHLQILPNFRNAVVSYQNIA